MNRQTKNTLKRGLLSLHRAGESLGVSITPVHYYSAIPNVQELERTKSIWCKKSDMPGIHVDLKEQGDELRKWVKPYQAEFAGNPHYFEGVKNHFGPGYGYVEAQCLHGVVRHLKPPRIVEVGSGVSTYCMTQAVALNEKETGKRSAITSVEPFPSQALKNLPGITLVAAPVQTCGLEVFTQLERGDFLFIDSSHTVKPGGDVNFLFLEVLPRLNPGVTVHIHDINFPFDYQHNVLQTMLFWMETSLLRAFLTHNARARILFCLSMLHYEGQADLKDVFPEYIPQTTKDGLRDPSYPPFDEPPGHFPSSIYIQTL